MSSSARPAVHWISLLAVGATILAIVGTFAVRSTRSREQAGFGRMPPGYVDDFRCAECHAAIAGSYARSGMGQDWRRWSDAASLESRAPLESSVQAGDFLYQISFRDGRHRQHEFRRDEDGQEFELQAREAVYVLGSGLQGRAYIASENGYLTILPLGWYSESGRWDLNPGYQMLNQRFARPVHRQCMSCHNATVAYQPGSVHAYVEPLPQGLGCQRCHGPGAKHVAVQGSGAASVRAEAAAGSIVNPARLSLDRQQDVCLQCHMLGDYSVPQPGCDAWSFRPGMQLRRVRSVFLDESTDPSFRAVGHGPRSMASACYQNSGGRMTCIFCHDPHRSITEMPAGHYNKRCLECHATQPCSRPLSPAERVGSGDCVACHMPKQSVSDIPHAAATEHWIRRTPVTSETPVSRSNTDLPLKPFWSDTSHGQTGSAIVRYFGALAELDHVRQGVALLEQALQETPGVAEWQAQLGHGYFLLGQWERALAAAERAGAGNADVFEARQVRGESLLRLGKKSQAVAWFEETLRRLPWCYEGDLTLAQAYWEAGEAEKLLDMEQRYFRRHPDDPRRLELVARALDRLGRPASEIDAVLDRAVRADGSLASPHLLRAEFAVRREDAAQVENSLCAVLRAEPSSLAARLVWAGFLAYRGMRDEAAAEARRILQQDPNNAAARRLLQDLGGR